jgi:hypothetical protein
MFEASTVAPIIQEDSKCLKPSTVALIIQEDSKYLKPSTVALYNTGRLKMFYSPCVYFFSLLKSWVIQNIITIKTSWNTNG